MWLQHYWHLLSQNYGRLVISSTLFLTLAISSSLILNPKRGRLIRKLIYRRINPRSRRKKNHKINIGAIFGMDVGGTLTKIVYFQQRKPDEFTPRPSSSLPLSLPPSSTTTTNHQDSGLQSPNPLPKRGSSDSLAQLDLPDHQAALQELYHYMDSTTGPSNNAVIRDDSLSIYSPFLEGKLHFLHFETRNMLAAINLVSASAFTEHVQSIGCTGGGAHKYSNEIFEKLEITVHKYDELGCLVRGMLFALFNFSNECYTYRSATTATTTTATAAEEVTATKEPQTAPSTITTASIANNELMKVKSFEKENLEEIHRDHDHSRQRASSSVSDQQQEESSSSKSIMNRWQKDVKEYTQKIIVPVYPHKKSFPYLLVNIGSGVSILKVTSPGQFQRVSGTSLGGGTYWGLCRLLTKCQTYEEVLDLAEQGDAGKVDMLVRDIYGGDYAGLLSGAMVASSFGKLVMKENPLEGVAEEDLALALLMMITNNIGQIAYLNAQLHSCTKIFFVGSFLRHNAISCRRLSFAIEFWSNGNMEALFLEHEGYFGALGTFLQSAFGEEVDTILANEYKYGSSNSKVPFQASEEKETKEGPNDNSNSSNSGKEKDAASSNSSLRRKTFNSLEKLTTSSTTTSNESDLSESTVPPVRLPTMRRGRSVSDDVTHRTSFYPIPTSPKATMKSNNK